MVSAFVSAVSVPYEITLLSNEYTDYYFLLKEFYPESILVMEKSKEHCASLINGNVYDVSGIRSASDFTIPSKIEEDFIHDFYNRMDNYDYERIIKLLKGKVKVNI